MSEVKVNKISPRSGTAFTLGDSGDTFTVPSGATLTTTAATVNLPATTTISTELKTNKISPATGTAFALGDSGDTFTVPSGATIVNSGTSTGFGDSLRPNANPFIINGGMEVDQRTAAAAAVFTNNAYGIDRWLNYLNGSWAGNYQQIDRSNSVVTDLQTDSSKNFGNVMMIDCTSAASLGATDLVGVLQPIEGYVHNPMAGKAITLSFWVRSTLTGIYCVAFKQGGVKTYVVEYTISSADTWEQKIITLTDDTLANYSSNTSTTNGSSLQLYFGVRLGTTAQQTTADAWNVGNFYGTSNQVTWGTSTSDFFYLAGVQIEMGTYTSATLPPFQFESFGNNLSRCLRYYQKSYAYASVVGTNTDVGLRTTSGSAGGLTTGYLYGDIEWQVNMRAAPTVTTYDKYNGTPGVCSRLNGGVARTDAQNISAAGITEKNCTINSTGTANAGAIDVHWRAVAEL